MSATDFIHRFPNLFQETIWPEGPLQVKFAHFSGQPPPANLIANVNIVPYSGQRWLSLQHADGQWDLPGGTLRPAEGYLDTLQRELMEEAGARLISFTLFGGWQCLSLAKEPYQPHLPFPSFYRVVGLGEVAITGPPTNPPDGEVVHQVALNSLPEVVRQFRQTGRLDLAELYQFAALLREDSVYQD